MSWASVFDEHGRQLAFSRREIDLVLPQTGLAELDPENYLVKVYETLRDVSAQCHGNIASIAVSSQAQDVYKRQDICRDMAALGAHIRWVGQDS